MARVITEVTQRPSGKWKVSYYDHAKPARHLYKIYVGAVDELGAYKEALHVFRLIDNKKDKANE